jgi:hypothetical protein
VKCKSSPLIKIQTSEKRRKENFSLVLWITVMKPLTPSSNCQESFASFFHQKVGAAKSFSFFSIANY